MPTGSVYGHIGHPQNTSALMDTISKLKQDLQKSQQEKYNMVEQMNVLVTLVKRALGGDLTATIHLANIVGIQPPDSANMALDPAQFSSNPTNTPVPEYKDRVIRAWERLSMKLLDREYTKIQDEIQEQQRKHIINRQLYMEEVLTRHAQEVNNVPTLHTRSRPGRTLEDVDKNFLRTFHQHSQKTGKQRPGSGKQRTLYRVKSAPLHRRRSNEGVDMTLNEILIEPSGQGTRAENTNKAFSGLYRMEADSHTSDEHQLSYDDPHRYQQTNLFDLDAVFGPSNENKKVRPVSAFAGSRGSKKNSRGSRPTSAVFVTQKGERPLKYETTRPVSGRPSAKQKQKPPSHSSHRQDIHVSNNVPLGSKLDRNSLAAEENTDSESDSGECANGNTVQQEQRPQDGDQSEEEEEVKEDFIGQNLRLRVDVATHQPKSVGKLVEEMKALHEMEDDFQKTVEQLQKKLGISENGMI